MAKSSLTAGELLDLLGRADSVIRESDGADEHAELLGELKDATDLLRQEIGASHMGTGADIVVIQAADTHVDARTAALQEVAAFFDGSGNETAAEELRAQYPDAFDGEEEDDDDGERSECGGCGNSYNATESDAHDADTYCSRQCERDDKGEEPLDGE